jgi:uncharacterized protein (TIGR02266 family)
MNKPKDGPKTGLEPIAKRVAIQRKTDLRFPNFEGLITGVSSNLSTSGMFIQSDSPEPAGTEFTFALRIEEWSPIQGTAKVIWIRSQPESPERPAGMGVQFIGLDAQSRRMIRWLVDKHMQEGGKPFDLDTVPAGASRYGGKTDEQTKSARSKRAGRRRRAGGNPKNKLLLGLLTLAIAAAIAYGSYLKWLQAPPDSKIPADIDAIAIGSSTPTDGTENSVEATEPIQADAEAITEVTMDEVAGFIDSWTDSWEARDASGIIAHYSPNFDASEYGNRQQWEAEVRRQVDNSEHIRVAVSALEISFPTAASANATFFRSFRSNLTNRSGRFVLELEPSASGWKIRSERSLE